jgi:plastocyanin
MPRQPGSEHRTQHFYSQRNNVVPGTIVSRVNNEVMPHTVVDLNKGFRSKTLVKDAKFSFTFPTAGDYSYLCSIHPNMKGKLSSSRGQVDGAAQRAGALS